MALHKPNPAAGDRGARGTCHLRKADGSPIDEIVIVVEPVDRRGRFAAWLGARQVVRSSRVPFCDAARVLIAERRDPEAIVVMRRRGSDIDALRARLGVAARLTVEERENRPPRFVPWKPLHVTDGSARTPEDDEAAPLREAAE
jgi:hypothetical protein